MKKNRALFQTISSLLILTLACEPFAYAAPEITKIDPLYQPKPDLGIPDSIASIEDHHRVGSGGTKMIYLIQDAHTNPSGQMNLSKTLSILLKKDPQIRYVFVEAGLGNNSLSYFRQFGTPETRRNAAEPYIRNGQLHGEEYLDLVGGQDFMLWGVENIGLYRQSIEDYQYVARERGRFEPYLSRIQTAIDILKNRLYNPVLLSFDAQSRRFRKGELPLTGFAAELESQVRRFGISPGRYPALKTLKELQEKEAAIDFKKANDEQAAAAQSLGETARLELDELVKAGRSPFKLSSDEHKEDKAFFTILEEKLGASAASYPELSAYFEYLKTARKISAGDILKEIKSLEEEIFSLASVTEDEKALGRAQKSTDLLSALFRLTMTPDEYEEYKALTAEFGIVRMTGFLNKKIMDLGAYYDRAVFLEEGYEDVVEKARKFYESTFARDSHFVKEILSVMNGNGQEHAVFIAGGFHAPNLKSLFKRENLSYASIMPQVTQETNQKRYESILLSQRGASTAASIPAKPLAVNMDRPTNQGTLVLYPELFPGRRSVLPEIAASLGTSVDAYVSAFAGIDGARLALTRREMLQRTAGLAVLASLPSMSAAQDEKTPENPFHEKDADLGKQYHELVKAVKDGKKPSADPFLKEYLVRTRGLLEKVDLKKDSSDETYARFWALSSTVFLSRFTDRILEAAARGEAEVSVESLQGLIFFQRDYNAARRAAGQRPGFGIFREPAWETYLPQMAELLSLARRREGFRIAPEAAVSLLARRIEPLERKLADQLGESAQNGTEAGVVSGFLTIEQDFAAIIARLVLAAVDEGRKEKTDLRKIYTEEVNKLAEATDREAVLSTLFRIAGLRNLVYRLGRGRDTTADMVDFLKAADAKILPLFKKTVEGIVADISAAAKKEGPEIQVSLQQAAHLKAALSLANATGLPLHYVDGWQPGISNMRPDVKTMIKKIEGEAISSVVKHLEGRQAYLKFNSFKRDGRETSLAEEIVRDVSGGIIYHYAQAILEHGKDPFDVIQLIADFEKKQGLGTVWELVRNADEKTRTARERLSKALREKGHTLPGGARLADISRRQFLATGLTAAAAGIVLGDNVPADEIQELRMKIASALARKKDKEKELKSAQENAGRIYRQALFGAVTTSVAFEGALIPEDRRGKDGEKYDIAAAKKMGRIANRLDPAGMGAQADAVLVMANGKQHLFRNLSDISLRPRKRLEPELPADVAESLKGFPGDIQQRLRDHGYYKNEKGDVISLKLHTMVVSKKDHLPVFGWRERVNGYMLEYEFYDFPGNKDAALSKKTVEMLKQYALLGYVLPTWNEIPVHPDVAKLHLADRARRENRYDLFYRYLILTDPATGLTYRYHIEGHYLNPKKYDPGVPYLRTNDNPLKSRDYLVISGTQSFFRQRSMKIDIRGKIYDQVSYDAERALLSDEREFSPDGVPNLSRLIDTVGLSKPTEKDGFYFSRLYGDPSRPPYYKASQNWPNSDLFARAVSYEDVLWNGGVIIPYDRRGLERFERSNRLAKGDMSQYQSYIPQSYQRELLVGDSAIRLVGADRAKRGRDLSRDMNEADSQADKLRIGSEIRLLGPYQDPKFLPPIETFWHVDENWLGNTIPSPRHADSAVEKLKTEIDALNETIKESQKTLQELEKDGARLARTFHEGNFGRDYQAEVIKEGGVHKLVLSFNKDFGGLEVDDGNSKTSYHRIKIPIVSAGTYTMKDNIYGKSYIVTVKEDRKSKKFSIKVSENPDQPKRTASVKTQFVKKREATSSRRKPGFFFSISITVSNEIRRILGFRNGRTTGDLRMGLEDSSDTDWDSGRKGRTGKRDRDGARLAASAKEVSQFRQLLREKLGKHYAVRADRMSVSDERIAAVIDAEDTRSAVRDLVGPLSPKGGIEPFVSLVERQRALHPKPKSKEDAAAPKPVPANLSLILSRDYGRSIEGAKKLLADTIDYLIAQGAPRPNLLAALKEDILAKGVQMNAGSINSSHSLTISKIFSQQQTLTAIEINAALLLTVQESLREQKDREGAAQYFIEYFGSLAAREAAGMQIMKFSPEWKKMFDNAAVFSAELTGYGIDISVRDPRAWNQAYFTRYSSEILSSVGRAVGLEVTEAEEKEKFLQWAAGKGLYTPARVDAFLSGSTGIYAETLKFLNFGVRHQTKPGREAKIEGALDTHIPANLYSVIANGRVTQLTEAVYLVFTYFEMSHNRLSAAAYLDERGKAVFAIRQRQTPQAFYTDLRLFKRTAENLLSTISSVADGDQAILNSAARLASEAGSAKEPDLGPDAASRAFFAGAGRLLPSADSKRRIALDLRVYDLTRNSGKVIVEGYGQPVVIDLESGSHQKVSESLKQNAVYNPDLTDRVMKLAEINAVGSPAFPPQAPFVVYLHDLDGQLTGVAQADRAKLANLLTHLSEKAVVILEGSDKAVALAREVIREKGIQNPGRFFTQVPADYEKTQAVHLISKHSYLNPIPAFAAKIAGIFSDHAQHYWLAMENDNQSGQTGVFAFGAIESMIEKIVSGDIEGAYAIFRQLYAATNAGEEPTLSDFQDFLKGDRSKIQRFAIRPILAKSLQEAYKMYQLEQAIRTNA